MLQCLLSKIRRRCGKEVFYEAMQEQTEAGRAGSGRCHGPVPGACGSDTSNDTTTDTSGDGAATAGNYTVGICQQMQHAALDAATQALRMP